MFQGGENIQFCRELHGCVEHYNGVFQCVVTLQLSKKKNGMQTPKAWSKGDLTSPISRKSDQKCVIYTYPNTLIPR